LLGGEAAYGASVGFEAQPDDLRLEVEGIGRVQLPVRPKQTRQPRELGQPAQFGRGG